VDAPIPSRRPRRSCTGTRNSAARTGAT
jgi:hypothetical protein